MIFRSPSVAALLLAAVSWPAHAATPPLLEEAVQKWTAENVEWAFTQRVRTFHDDGRLKEERLERYDPSQPDHRRWHLLKFNGKPPTEEQRERWEHRRNRKPRKRSNKPPGEYFDFENAIPTSETAHATRYDVPFRPEAARLVQLDKLAVEVTVNKANRTIEHVSAELRATMQVALGLAKVTDLDLDIHFDSDTGGPSSTSDKMQATGSAQATVSKLGNRAEYAWSDFKQVTAFASTSGKPGSSEPATKQETGQIKTDHTRKPSARSSDS